MVDRCGVGPPVLIVGGWESRCGACNKGADPYEARHVTVLPGLSGHAATRDGCGIRWTHVAPTEDLNPEAIRIRPDLILVNSPKEVQ